MFVLRELVLNEGRGIGILLWSYFNCLSISFIVTTIKEFLVVFPLEVIVEQFLSLCDLWAKLPIFLDNMDFWYSADKFISFLNDRI